MDVATEIPVVEPTAPVEDGSTSLSDHEAQFGPGATRQPTAVEEAVETRDEGERDDKGRFVKPPTHRAQSHKAGAQDVEEIAAQTKRLRQAEQDAGIVAPERKAGESDRAYNLRRQADIAEALRDAKKAKPAPVAPQPAQRVEHPRVAYQPQPFTKPKPKADQFANEDDPAEAYIDAIADWRIDKRLHEANEARLAQETQQSQQQQLAAAHATKAALDSRIAEFEKTTPDFWAKLAEVDVEELTMPNVMIQALASDVDNAPKLMYHLATHPDDLVDAIGYAMPFVDDLSSTTVALVRRRLNRYLSQALGATAQPSTGAPAPAPSVTVAPRPPTPVRTGPLKTGDEPPGDDDSSIDSHEKHFGPKRRR